MPFLIIFFAVLSTTPFLLHLYQHYSIQSIPEESPESQKKLNKLINISKYDPENTILQLEELKNLPKYTEYKKNYILGKLYSQVGKIEKAISIYEDLSNKNYPLKERVLFHLAYLNTQTGNDKTALKYFNKLLHDFPDSKSVPQAKYYLAQTQLRLKLTNQALNTLKSLRAKFPDTQYGIATNYYLGEHAYHKENYAGAFNYWRKYLEFSPDGRFASDIANIYNSITASEKIPLTAKDYLLLGDVFFHKKEYKDAAKYYKLVNDPEKYYNLGYSLYRIGEKEEAYKYLKEYAYKYNNAENTKLALYYASYCLPYNKRKSFWKDVTKDIPKLSYYTIYKQAQLENSERKREKMLKNLIVTHPQGEFTLDAAWEIIWQKILDKEYKEAEALGKEYFKLSESPVFEHTNTRAKIGFFLGKLAELSNETDNARSYYEKASDVAFDDYYSIRSSFRLKELNGSFDPKWSLQTKIQDFNNLSWTPPLVMKLQTIKEKYGSTVFELTKLQQFDEAIELIGKNKSPSEKITAWLKALNNEFETSVNLASKVAIKENLQKDDPLWKLAYPLYYWQHVKHECNKYQNIDPFLVYGVMRQESRFDTNAVSVSNARGLMQFIPPTARTVAYQNGINLHSLDLLHTPEINIALGVRYLKDLIQELNNPLFAVASYNAGPNVVKRWINNSSTSDIDFFIEQIPYFQTKDYVKKVFAGYWTYLKLYRGNNQSLEETEKSNV